MWSSLPFDLLANIFSFLAPDSLARAKSTCRHWHDCVEFDTRPSSHHHPSWFIALPFQQNKNKLCFAHNPNLDNWHNLSLEFLPDSVKPIASVGSLLLLRSTSPVLQQLIICNPFTKQFQYLPISNITRTNPVMGVVIQKNTTQHSQFSDFKVYVAGGMSKAPQGGTTYESKLEMYDSRNVDSWKLVGSLPVEFAVRLTVWTQNESVYSNGVLYWITSARAFSVMGFEIDSNICRGFQVPMADRLEFAALTTRAGRLTLVGGACGEDACVWEYVEGDMWELVEKVPNDLGIKLLGGSITSWKNTKCVGNNEIMCLYKEVGNGMVVWRERKDENKWEWLWINGCSLIRSKRVPNLPLNGLFLLQPSLATFSSYSNYTL